MVNCSFLIWILLGQGSLANSRTDRKLSIDVDLSSFVKMCKSEEKTTSNCMPVIVLDFFVIKQFDIATDIVLFFWGKVVDANENKKKQPNKTYIFFRRISFYIVNSIRKKRYRTECYCGKGIRHISRPRNRKVWKHGNMVLKTEGIVGV